ncbi:hypothetical protein ScPMuIL_017481 [Solemya velum]
MPVPDGVVHFPCEEEIWPTVKHLLCNIKEYCSDENNFNLEQLAVLHQQAVNVCHGVEELTPFGNCLFYGLVKFLRKYASSEEKRQFLGTILPTIIDLSLQLEHVIPRDGLKYSRQQESGSIVLRRRAVASILACSFLCLFPERGKTWKTKNETLNEISFSRFFRNLPCPSQNAKLRCILNYFNRIAVSGRCPAGSIIYSRQVIPLCEVPTLDTWLNCNSVLCPVIVHQDGVIEDSGYETLHVDFANRFIGGGVLGRGRVQEEIKFSVCPELIVSLLFMECMKPNEAIVIQGYEHFSKIEGYAASLEFAGDYQDPSLRDENGILMNSICAIDAVSYRGSPRKQYDDLAVLRDLNKAYAGFCYNPESVMVDSDWSSISTDEEYLTASEDEEQGFHCTENENIFYEDFVENLLRSVLPTALLEAADILKATESQKDNLIKIDSADDTNNDSITEANDHEDDGMDHLDIDYHEWLSQFQRRSSAFSDITSRRSSCSTRLSSEYSSEFEELYENFQKREYHTIKEEVGTHFVTDFASTLAAKLLKEGTTTAAQMTPGVQNFDTLPLHSEVSKPMAVRMESTSQVSEDVARKFAEKFFHEIWPFSMSHDNTNCSEQFLEGAQVPGSGLSSDGSDVDFSGSYVSNSVSKEPDGIEKYAASFVNQIVGDLLVADNVPGKPRVTNVVPSVDSVSPVSDNASNISELQQTDCPDGKCLKIADQMVSQIFQSLSSDVYEIEKTDKCIHKEVLSTTSHQVMPSENVDDSATCPEHEGRPSGSSDEEQIISTNICEKPKALLSDCNNSDFEARKNTKGIENAACNPKETAKSDSFLQTSGSDNFSQIVGFDLDKPLLIVEEVVSDIESNKENLPPSDSPNFESGTFSDNSRSSSVGSSGRRGSKNSPNMDFFASVLSRDLLTNAFLEVQMTAQRCSYLRRSSEPFKLTNNVSMQYIVEKNAERGRKVKPKGSRSDEDIGLFNRRFSYDPARRRSLGSLASERRRSSTGFHDPTLSRFAEELMKTKCSVPKFHVIESSNRSTTSSGSRRSTVSGFKDPILAGFEEELLSRSIGLSSKASLSRSVSNKLSKQCSICDTQSSFSGMKSVSFESEYSSKSQDTSKSSSADTEHVLLYAERLASEIVVEALCTACYTIRGQTETLVEQFAQKMASSILLDAMASISKKVTDLQKPGECSQSENIQSNSRRRSSCTSITSSHLDYEDALDVPIFLLEGYADQIANTVLHSSVNIWKREVQSEKRRFYGCPVATGNWGCGAFRGDPHVKSLLQWMAASYAGVPLLLFYSFSNPLMIRFQEVVDILTARGWTVGHLMKAIRTYCDLVSEQYNDNGENTLDLFDILISNSFFPDSS